jgi:hypothetical protein
MTDTAALGAFGALVVASVAASAGAAHTGPERSFPVGPSLDLHLPRPVDPRVQMSVVTTSRGHGPTARAGDAVRVRYTGKPPGASVRPDAPDAGARIDFVLGAGEVIAGWDQAIAGMKVGEKRKLVIPPAMAYGARGAAGVLPGETLVYEVELLELLTIAGEGDED